MSAMPDLLLQSPSEVRGRTRAPAKAPESPQNEGSSFASVYAKERDQHATSPAHERVERKDEPVADAAPQPADSGETEPVVADTGNDLPPEQAPSDELDPLLAMALQGTQQSLTATVSQLPTDAAGEQVAALDELGRIQAAFEDALGEGDEQAAQADVVLASAAEQVSKGPAAGTRTEFAAAMASMTKPEATSVEGAGESTLETIAKGLGDEAIESLKDSVQPLRPDQFVSKLNALTQAINPQSASRAPVLVPGSPVAMQQSGWGEAVVDKVMWMSSQNLKSAEIQLDPAELGRLEVRVNLTQDQAQVTFASANASVRDALEGQMQRLREMFAQQGMNLADANVSDQSFQRGQESGERNAGGRSGDLLGGDDVGTVVAESTVRGRAGMGLVDYYA